MDPHLTQKSRYFPHLYFTQKNPISHTKEPYISRKIALYCTQRYLHRTKRALYLRQKRPYVSCQRAIYLLQKSHISHAKEPDIYAHTHDRRHAEDVTVLLPLLKRMHTIRNLPEIAQRALCAVVTCVHVPQTEYVYRKVRDTLCLHLFLSLFLSRFPSLLRSFILVLFLFFSFFALCL